MIKLAPYAKLVAAVIGQALTTAELYFPGNRYLAIAIAAGSVLAVYAVPNQPKGPKTP